MKLMTSIKDFETYLRHRHRSEHTIRAYVYTIRQFYREYRSMSFSNLDRYRMRLLEQYKPQTVNQRICALNQYIAFMKTYDEEAAELFQPLISLKQIKLQQKCYLENVISNSDFNYLKSRLERDNNMRWYFIIRLMSSTGVRVSELIQMKYEHLEAGFMEICSKGGKTRRVLIPRELCSLAMQYYQSQGIRSGFIILNASGHVITPRGINAMLKTFALRYHMNTRTMYPHAFRHLYAQNFLKRCPDIALLADLLGHDSIETTRIYLKKSGAEQKKIVDKIVTW